MTTAVNVAIVSGSVTYTVPVGVRFIGGAFLNGSTGSGANLVVNGAPIASLVAGSGGVGSIKPIAANAGDVISCNNGAGIGFGLIGQLF